MLLMIGHPGCSTCKRARAWLTQKGQPHQWRDIRTDNPSREELDRWQTQSDLPISRFFNTSGQLYRDMGLGGKKGAMSREEQLAVLASDGMLVKRPILVRIDDSGKEIQFLLIGFREKEWEALLGENEEHRD